MGVRSSDDFIALYSQIYFACHTRHVHDPESGTRVSARQASILSHLDSVEPTPLSQLASHMGVTVSTMSIAVDRLGFRLPGSLDPMLAAGLPDPLGHVVP